MAFNYGGATAGKGQPGSKLANRSTLSTECPGRGGGVKASLEKILGRGLPPGVQEPQGGSGYVCDCKLLNCAGLYVYHLDIYIK